MSIKLLTPWGGYPIHTVISLDSATEAALVADAVATDDLTDGIAPEIVDPALPDFDARITYLTQAQLAALTVGKRGTTYEVTDVEGRPQYRWNGTAFVPAGGGGDSGSSVTVVDAFTGGTTSALSAQKGKELFETKAPLDSAALTGTPSAPTPASSDTSTRIATMAALHAVVAQITTGLLDLKGGLSAAASPNYPAALKGDSYYVTAAGKLGGASGIDVAIGDLVVASADNAGGTQAAVGSSWFNVAGTLEGALLVGNNLSDVDAVAARGNLSVYSAAQVDALLAGVSGAAGALVAGEYRPVPGSIFRVRAVGTGVITLTGLGFDAVTEIALGTLQATGEGAIEWYGDDDVAQVKFTVASGAVSSVEVS